MNLARDKDVLKSTCGNHLIWSTVEQSVPQCTPVAVFRYAMGYLEGLATAEYLWLFYHINTEKTIGSIGRRTSSGEWIKES